MSAARPVGIEAINVYCGLARTSVRDMMEGRGLDTARQANLMMEQRSVQLPFDGEGRITLPGNLAAAVGIGDEVAFVGRRKTFQLWEPKRLAAHEAAARSAARAKDISLSKIIAAASRFENGGN